MLTLVHAPIAAPDATRREIALRVDRITLAKRLWRGRAEDGTEFGFQLKAPLADGATVAQQDTVRYVVRQLPERVLSIPLVLPAAAVAGIGWAIGNLHVSLAGETQRLLAPDEPAVRSLLERLNVAFEPTVAVFRPGRFARGDRKPDELGPGHSHSAGAMPLKGES